MSWVVDLEDGSVVGFARTSTKLAQLCGGKAGVPAALGGSRGGWSRIVCFFATGWVLMRVVERGSSRQGHSWRPLLTTLLDARSAVISGLHIRAAPQTNCTDPRSILSMAFSLGKGGCWRGLQRGQGHSGGASRCNRKDPLGERRLVFLPDRANSDRSRTSPNPVGHSAERGRWRVAVGQVWDTFDR